MKMIAKRLIFSILIILTLAFLVGCKLEGHATNGCSGEPISNATVTVEQGGTSLTTATDSSGYYVFDDLDESEYTVTISHPDWGFYPDSGQVAFSTSSQKKTFDFSGIDKSKAWKKHIGNLTYVYFSGSPSEIGCQHGTLLKEEILMLREMTASSLPDPDVLHEIVTPWINHFESDELAELEALSNASGIGFDEAVFLNIQVDIGALGSEHCSGFAARATATSDQKLYQGFNMDTDNAALWVANSVVAFYNPDNKFSFVAPILVGSIGVFTGMNSKQLVLDSQDAGHLKDPTFTGTSFRPATAMLRKALQESSTIGQMTSLLTSTSLSYRPIGLISIISGGHENAAVSAEILGSNSYIRPMENNVIWSANNFQADWYWDPIYIPDPNDRALLYEELLLNPGTLHGSVNINSSKTQILGQSPICDVVRNRNGLSVVFAPHDGQNGQIHISTLARPACMQEYAGFDFYTKNPL